MSEVLLFIERAIAQYFQLIIIVALGTYFTFKSNFFQFKNLKKSIIGSFDFKDKENGEINTFQAVCTNLASTIGTGNIVGVATAVSLGGPGAVFWMALSSFFSMIIKFFEIVLAMLIKDNNSKGPLSYINSVGKKWKISLGFLFSAFCVFSSITSGNITQINSISAAISNKMIVKLFVGIFVGLLVFIIISGGIKRIAVFSEKAVPIMSVLYIFLCLGIIVCNIKNIPLAFYKIFVGAFSPKAITGGAVGSIWSVINIGFSRGIFSNEAGLGTAAFSHTSAANKNSIKEGFCGIFEVFFDTLIICTLTGVTIVCSGVEIEYGTIVSSELIKGTFSLLYGAFSDKIISLMLFIFGITSIVAWSFFAVQCIDEKYKKIYVFAYPLFCVFGAVCSVKTAWRLAAFFNGLMLIINMICVSAKGNLVLQKIKDIEISQRKC